MPHDGQDTVTETALMPGLLALTGAALEPVSALFESARERVRGLVSEGGKVSATLIEAHQGAAHGLSWLATYAESLRQMQRWAEKLEGDGRFGEIEQLIHQIAFGEYLAQILGGIPMSQGEIVRPQDMGLSRGDLAGMEAEAVQALAARGNSQAARMRLVELIRQQAGSITYGASGLEEELEMIRDQFRRYVVDKVEPHAHDWHLKDELIPMEVIGELAEMGVFGLTIPEAFGGLGLSGTGPKAGGPQALLRYAHEQSISRNIMAEGGDPQLLGL